MKIIKHVLQYMALSLIAIMIYIELSHFWVDNGGLRGESAIFELPILLVILFELYSPTLNKYKNLLNATITIFSLYILFDIYYYFLSRSPRPSDFENISAISDFSPLMSIGLFVMILLIILPFLYSQYHMYKNSNKQTFITFLMLKIISIVILIYYLNYLFLHNKFHYYNWSQARTIKNNGRIASFIYYANLSKQAHKKLYAYKNINVNVNKLLFNTWKIKNKKNIYIIVLESFIDPRLIKNVSFNRSPLAQEMKQYLNNDEFSYIKSPVYGGGTAQAEFEILTGVQALAKVNGIEFNTLESKKIPGFINVLQKNSYHTYATIATNSNYYNSKVAYKSIGFKEIEFLEESSNFILQKEDNKIFDGDVYNYNLSKLNQDSLKKPYLAYILGMYGHFPYKRNLAKRPNMISVIPQNEEIRKIANQFYYRTQALANYITKILRKDPTAIIFVSSDHIPPILHKNIQYKKSKYDNIALLLVDGKAININGYHQYDIPRLIFKILNNDHGKLKVLDSSIYTNIYFKTLSQSLQ